MEHDARSTDTVVCSRGRAVAPILRPGVGADAARVLGAALYGAAIGLWNGGEQALYSALKLPLVLLLTWLLTLPWTALLSWSLGRRAALREVAAETLAPLGAAALLLAAITPVAALFSLSFPEPGSGARTEHNLLFVFHCAAVGVAGLAGVARFRGHLATGLDAAAARRLVRLWTIAYAAVGSEVAWTLRPFVGSVYAETEFLRANALEGNLAEFLLTEIAPHLVRRLFEGGE